MSQPNILFCLLQTEPESKIRIRNGEGIGIKWKTELAAQISDMNSSIFPIVLAQVRSIFILLSPVEYETHSSIQFLHPVNPSTLQTVFACREASLN